MQFNDSGDARATKILLVLNVAIFTVTEFILAPPGRALVMDLFGLSADDLFRGWLWQVVTYQFLHGSTVHLLLNMLGVWFAGRELERAVGTRLFLAVYFGSGIVGGVAQVLFSGSTTLLIGASGSMFGILVAVTALFPNLPVTALLFFVLPVRMKAKTLGWLAVGSSVVMWILGFEPGIGHLAHLGGAATGFLMARGIVLTGGRQSPFSPPARVFATGHESGDRRPFPPVFTVVPPSRSEHRNVEDVLAKLVRDGIDSLSREEHRILEAARRERPRRWR